MKKIRLLVVLLALAVAGTWFWYWYNPDRNIIDEDYTDTEMYRSLQQQLEAERSEFSGEEQVLDEVVSAMLQQGRHRQIPTTIKLDSLTFDTLISEALQIPVTSKTIDSGTSFYRFGRLSSNDITALVFIIKKPGVYADFDLILATVVNDTLQDTEWIAAYRKNISEEVTGELIIEADSAIAVTQHRLRQYPVQQLNQIAYRYEILKNGSIETKTITKP